MKESKDIDRLFQEKFRDFEVNPPEKVWKSIDQKINPTSFKSQRPYWKWLSGIAVGLLLLFTLNNPMSDNKINIIPTLFDNNVSVDEPKIIPSVLDNKTDVMEKNITSLQPEKAFNKEPKTLVNPIKKNKVHFKLTKTLDELVYDDTKEPYWVSTNELPVFFVQETKDDYFQSEITQIKTPDINRWSISTIAAPIFLNGFHNNMDEEEIIENQATQKGKVSLSYGVQFAYQLSKRFSLQSGIHKVDFAYNDVDVAQVGEDEIVRASNSKVLDVQSFKSLTGKTDTEDKITQIYGYVEIPLEAKYRLNNEGNFGVNLIGGFSTLLLNKNELYIETSTGIFEEPGVENKFNSLNFSGNFGVELEYKVFKNVNFNLIPMFKVQTHTLNSENTLYTPYSLGLYSGLNLRF
jgi:hypothetical protein